MKRGIVFHWAIFILFTLLSLVGCTNPLGGGGGSSGDNDGGDGTSLGATATITIENNESVDIVVSPGTYSLGSPAASSAI
ncbi:hypothetical protein KQH65_12145, partial [archaeon]|nr:hypothetical protein [archaeon]